jgi:hypothetical protein
MSVPELLKGSLPLRGAREFTTQAPSFDEYNGPGGEEPFSLIRTPSARNCKLKMLNCKLKIDPRQSPICNFQFTVFNLRFVQAT